MNIDLVHGDCREVMPFRGPFDMIFADPPYGDTALDWDRRVEGWHKVAHDTLKSTGSLWVFGALRYFMAEAPKFEAAGLQYAQEIVWEKHNGSGFRADRFKRVHELAVQFYRAEAAWADVYNDVQTTPDAVARTVKRRKRRPTHMGKIDTAPYLSVDGGPLLMRSVLFVRSCHGRAIHPTEKPIGIIEPLLRTSCPPDGLIADFFAGSGAVGEAARMLGRRYIGTEIQTDYFEAARDRLDFSLPLVAA